jgi:hypothetical protein
MLKGVPKTTIYGDLAGALAGSGAGATLWARQGLGDAGRGDLFGALRCFQRSLEIDLDCLDAWMGLAEVFDRMNDTRRSLACLDVVRRIRGREVREATA